MEKRIAIASVLIGMLIPIGAMLYTAIPTNFDEIMYFGINLLLYWGAFCLACVLYTRIRSAAVTGSALTVTLVYMGFFCYIETYKDPKAGALWILYFVWSIIAFVISIIPALVQPKIFTKSAWSAFFSSVLTTCSVYLLHLLMDKLTSF
ncbi:hypothetical protein [Neisseria sp.]|uniref:hypothetical protein n=1 Tax=Neisseria sp. TaxID=192066 RepID=UPI0035A09D46